MSVFCSSFLFCYAFFAPQKQLNSIIVPRKVIFVFYISCCEMLQNDIFVKFENLQIDFRCCCLLFYVAVFARQNQVNITIFLAKPTSAFLFVCYGAYLTFIYLSLFEMLSLKSMVYAGLRLYPLHRCQYILIYYVETSEEESRERERGEIETERGERDREVGLRKTTRLP